MFAVTAAALGIGLQVMDGVLGRVASGQRLALELGFAAGLAFVLVVVYALIDQLTGDEARTSQDPMSFIQAFNQRTLGVVDDLSLASATAELLTEKLKVHVSGWLLLTPHDNAVTARPIPGKGNFPLMPIELSRQNVLLRQITQRREPVRRAELLADAQYNQTPPAERQWLKELDAEVCAPVYDAGILTAILVVGPKEGRRSFERADVELIGLLAAQAAAVLRATRQTGEAKQLQRSISLLQDQLSEKDVAVAKMDSSRSDFLAIASHELRTPITQLLGFADLLGAMAQDNTLDAETVAQITDSIVRACGRLNEVISQILDMAQLDVNALNLNFKTTSLEVILRQAIEPYVMAMRERRLALKISGYKGLPPLQADEQRLAQAFNQLMSNAIKFTPDGGQIEINLKPLPAEDGLPPHIQITFADTGIGIDPQYHTLIFDKFYRIGSSAQHSTSTTKFMGGGPGLGLPIARGVIERHGGRIWVESDGHDPQKMLGSRFHVVLPLKPPAFDPRALTDADTGPRRDTRTHIPRTPFVG